MKRLNHILFIMARVALLLHGDLALAQISTGGDLSGGMMRKCSELLDEHLNHRAAQGNVWMGYKGKRMDWRVSVSGKHSSQDSEKESDAGVFSGDNPFLTSSITSYNVKPTNISARYDINWCRGKGNRYNLWALYDYEHMDYESFLWGMTMSMTSQDVGFGRCEKREDFGHKAAGGFRGSWPLNDKGLTMSACTDVSLQKRRAEDAWMRFSLDLTDHERVSPRDGVGWTMNPKWTTLATNASVTLSDSLLRDSSALLMLGGGVKVMVEHCRFHHDWEVDETDIPGVKVDNVFIDQRATGTRSFIEPFVCAKWTSKRWSVDAEYGVRLFRMSTSDDLGHGMRLHNMIYKDMPITDAYVKHFTLLLSGRSKVVYKLSKHHRISLTNTIGSRLPSCDESMLCFVQTHDYNVVQMGNAHLKPEVRIAIGLDHTLTLGSFTATTGVVLDRVNNEMDCYDFNCTLEGHNELADMTLNVADVNSLKVCETLSWKGKRLTANVGVWKRWSHSSGVGSIFEGTTHNGWTWGWLFDGKVNMGHGWMIASQLEYSGSMRGIASERNERWPASTIAMEKSLGPMTLYVRGTNLIEPETRKSEFDGMGNEVKVVVKRLSRRMIMLGIRWRL